MEKTVILGSTGVTILLGALCLSLIDWRNDTQDCVNQVGNWTRYQSNANSLLREPANARYLAIEFAKVRLQCANSTLKEGEAYRAPPEISKLASEADIVKEALARIKAGKT